MKQKEITESLSLCGAVCLLQALCQSIRNIRKYSGEGPLSEEQQVLIDRINELQSSVMEKYACPEEAEIKVRALLALMDAYEITGGEYVLQFVLPQAESLLVGLDDSAQKCKLLAYCYYYTEDEECAREARRILNTWDRLAYTPEMADAAVCCDALV